MRRTVVLSRTLAIAGTVLAGFPIAATVLMSIIGTISEGRFLFDYLMPAELFIAVLAGGLLLLWAAFRTRLLRKPVAIGLVAAAVFLALCQLTAVLSGIASGAAAPEGPAFIFVIALLVVYLLAVIMLDVTGIVLTRALFKPEENR